MNETTIASSNVFALVIKKKPKVKYSNSCVLKPKTDMSKVNSFGCNELGSVKNNCPIIKSAPLKSSASGSTLFGKVLVTAVPADILDMDSRLRVYTTHDKINFFCKLYKL